MGDVIDDAKIYYWFFGANASEFGLEAGNYVIVQSFLFLFFFDVANQNLFYNQ